MYCPLTLKLLHQLILVLINVQMAFTLIQRMSAKNASIIAKLAIITIVAKFAILALSKQMILNSAILGLAHLVIIYKLQIVRDANQNVLLVAQVQHVIPALQGILMLQEVNVIQNVVMVVEMMTKNVTMETLMMKMVVQAIVQQKKTMFVCLLTQQQWVQMFASAMRSLYLPPGLSIGAKLKSNLDLKLYTILIMALSLLMPKFSALKYCKPLCLTIKTQALSTTAFWMPVRLRVLSELMLIQMLRLVILISNSKQKLSLTMIL